MWKKQQKEVEPTDRSEEPGATNDKNTPVSPKYQKPKTLTIDLPSECAAGIRGLGYQCDEGTFGTPYKVPPSDSWVPVIWKAQLPDFTEQEIVIIDLTPPKTVDKPEGEPPVAQVEKDWWCKCANGEIDPRSRAMAAVQVHFDLILDHGGTFVVFAQPRIDQDLHFTTLWQKDFSNQTSIHYDNWSFLSVLDNLGVEPRHGREMSVALEDAPAVSGMKKFLQDGRYAATITPNRQVAGEWTDLFKDKYDRTIGGVLVRKASRGNGMVWVLPQISDKAGIITHLFEELMPAVSPHLFPEFEGGRWVERSEYRLPAILDHINSIEEIKANAKRKIKAVQVKIDEERSKYGFLDKILTSQGSELVESVEDCLKFIGFSDVVDVDAKVDSSGKNSRKQEDLQILDGSPSLLVEVKGLSGFPGEADVLQVLKYVTRRTSEWDRTDVRGIFIVNHQKNIPALDRNNLHAFPAPQPKDALDSNITLITTWELFLLARAKMRWNWPSEVVKELFCTSGRISCIPTHYVAIGIVEKYWPEPEAVAIRLNGSGLSKGQRIAFVTPSDYLEQIVTSLQVDGNDVDNAASGDLVSIKVEYSKSQIRPKTSVYNVGTG